jgi:two-component system, OmpR family, sensor histidine kinase MprB
VWNKARLGVQELAAQRLHEELGARDEQFRHDLRQPLTAAALLLEQVANLPSLERGTTARIRETQRQVRWALDLLRSQEDGETSAVVLDLGETISAVVDPDDSQCEVSLVFQAHCYVVAQYVDLVRAARNLLDNAVHAATWAGGPQLVEVSVRTHQGLAVLAVDDSGPGFGQVPRRHGLGLASVREFAQRSGGSVTVGTSRWGGASVALCLPAAAQRMAG